jgi:hypothetical protein
LLLWLLLVIVYSGGGFYGWLHRKRIEWHWGVFREETLVVFLLVVLVYVLILSRLLTVVLLLLTIAVVVVLLFRWGPISRLLRNLLLEPLTSTLILLLRLLLWVGLILEWLPAVLLMWFVHLRVRWWVLRRVLASQILIYQACVTKWLLILISILLKLLIVLLLWLGSVFALWLLLAIVVEEGTIVVW